MYKIEKTAYGLRVTMGGVYSANEIRTYIEEKEKLISEITGPFSMLVDLRSAIPPDRHDQKLLEESQIRMKRQNLLRMAIITRSPVVHMRGNQIAIDAGIDDRTRIINATAISEWETLALEWIVDGIEPELSVDSEPWPDRKHEE